MNQDARHGVWAPLTGENTVENGAPLPVASYAHFRRLIAIVAGVAVLGALQSLGATGSAHEAHRDVVTLYLSACLMDAALVYFVWKGVQKNGGRVSDLIGGNGKRVRDIALDVALAGLFWGALLPVLWVVDTVLGRAHVPVSALLLPQTAPEVALWIATSATAGFCEEIVFRGYAQRQLLALWQKPTLAVLGQGVLFGLMHAYQGWKPVCSTAIIGMCLGALAQVRGSLRPGILAHTWMDVWGGWLARVVGR